MKQNIIKGIPATAWMNSLSTGGRLPALVVKPFSKEELDRRLAIVQRLEAELNGGAK